MADQQMTASDHLGLNKTIFHVSLVFLLMGMLADFLQNSHHVWQVSVVTYSASVGTCLLLFILEARRVITPGFGLVVAFAMTVTCFTAGTLLDNLQQPEHRLSWIANPQIPLLLSMFGTIAGITVDKRVALGFGVACIAAEVWFAFGFHNSGFYQEQLAMNVCVVGGAIIMVWYYRSKLEGLVRNLGKRLVTVRELKEQVEKMNEQNRPFVVFGRNTTGLVADFGMLVDRLSTDLVALRQLAAAGDPVDGGAVVLAGMHLSMEALNQRTEWVKYLASATAQRKQEEIDLEKLVQSALYPFRILPEYRETIEFRIGDFSEVRFRGLRLPLLQAIENLVSTGCGGGATSIRLDLVKQSAEWIELEYSDNGLAADQVWEALDASLRVVPEMVGAYALHQTDGGMAVRFRAGLAERGVDGELA